MSFCWHEGAPVSVPGPRGETVCYQPRWLLPYHADVVRLRRGRTFESVWDFCRQVKPRKIAFYRTYALGDVLMLIPVIRLLRRLMAARAGYEMPAPVFLITGYDPWRGLGGRMDSALVRLEDIWVVRSHGIREYGADVHFFLDHCLEADHRGGPESELHRLELYGRAMGIPA